MYLEACFYEHDKQYARLNWSSSNGTLYLYVPKSEFTLLTDFIYQVTIPELDSGFEDGTYGDLSITEVSKIADKDLVTSLVLYTRLIEDSSNTTHPFLAQISKFPIIYDNLLASYPITGDALPLYILRTLLQGSGKEGYLDAMFKFLGLTYTPKYYVFKTYFEVFASTFEPSPGVTLLQYLQSNLTGQSSILYNNARAIISSSTYVQNIKQSLGMNDAQCQYIFTEATKYQFNNYDTY